MFKDHAKIIHAISTAGEISGRKKLQKIVFIAKKLAFPFQEKYQFHFYGPYSEELTLRVEELCNMGYLNEVREKRAGIINIAILLRRQVETFYRCKRWTCRH